MTAVDPVYQTAYNQATYDLETQRLERDGRRIATVSLVLTIGLRILIFLGQCSVTATAAYSLQQYWATQNATSGGTALWLPNTQLFPTQIALAVAVVHLFVNGVEVFSYCFGKKKGDTVVGAEATFNKYYDIASKVWAFLKPTISTIAAGVTLGTSANTNALSNQTCSPNADAIQPSFPQINLGNICIVQTFIQYAMLITTWLHACQNLIAIWGYVEDMHKKKVEKHNSMKAASPETEKGGVTETTETAKKDA